MCTETFAVYSTICKLFCMCLPAAVILNWLHGQYHPSYRDWYSLLQCKSENAENVLAIYDGWMDKIDFKGK